MGKQLAVAKAGSGLWVLLVDALLPWAGLLSPEMLGPAAEEGVDTALPPACAGADAAVLPAGGAGGRAENRSADSAIRTTSYRRKTEATTSFRCYDLLL